MLKVIDYNKMYKVIGKVNTYKEAWELIQESEMKNSLCVGKWDKEQWYKCNMQDEYPSFVWPDNVDYVWTGDWVPEPVIHPNEYTKESVRELIDKLLLYFKVEEV